MSCIFASRQPCCHACIMQVYNTAKLTLVTVGPQLSHDVTALACKGDLTFAATGSSIEESKRMHRYLHQISLLEHHLHTVQAVTLLSTCLLSEYSSWFDNIVAGGDGRHQFQHGVKPCAMHDVPDTPVS